MIKKVIPSFIILILFYLFLTFCNWSFHPMEWNGFSKFIMALGMLLTIFETAEIINPE